MHTLKSVIGEIFASHVMMIWTNDSHSTLERASSIAVRNCMAGAARLAAGLPTPVACCWNGLAVLDAAPLREGLRMRSANICRCMPSSDTLSDSSPNGWVAAAKWKATSTCAKVCCLRVSVSASVPNKVPATVYTQPDGLCRAHEPGECAASECSLLCADYIRLGRHRFVLDPGVRLVSCCAPAVCSLFIVAPTVERRHCPLGHLGCWLWGMSG